MFHRLFRGRNKRLKTRNVLGFISDDNMPKKFAEVRGNLVEASISTVNTAQALREADIEATHQSGTKSFNHSATYESNASENPAQASSYLDHASTTSTGERSEEHIPPAIPDARDELEQLQDILRDPPPIHDFQLLDLTDATRYPMPSKADEHEFHQFLAIPIKSNLPIIFTTLENGPREGTYRVFASGYSAHTLQIGQIVHVHGTITGYWVLQARKFRRDGSLYVECVDYLHRQVVIVRMLEEQFSKWALSTRERTKSMLRTADLGTRSGREYDLITGPSGTVHPERSARDDPGSTATWQGRVICSQLLSQKKNPK
ncbi:hypothetical protein DFH09DRAFT_1086131 [Mycena vulgaris]|nr:hypothetical protein DFH09DRAFT_1086131 [Mycena vulgaris]